MRGHVCCTKTSQSPPPLEVLARMSPFVAHWFRLTLLSSCMGAGLMTVFLGCKGQTPEDPNPAPSGVVDAGETPQTPGTPYDGGELPPATATCNPILQTGCSAAAPKCGLGGAKFSCQAAGSVALGGTCTYGTNSDDCTSGLVCVNGKCEQPCKYGTTEGACPSGYGCILKMEWTGGSTAGGETFVQCMAVGCSPLAQDCPSTSEACYLTSGGTTCIAPGTTADGAACVSANDCVKGSTCLDLGSGFRCFRVCSLSSGPSDGGTSTPDGGSPGLGCLTGTCRGVQGIAFGLCQ
jgi:hypothetical protein